ALKYQNHRQSSSREQELREPRVRERPLRQPPEPKAADGFPGQQYLPDQAPDHPTQARIPRRRKDPFHLEQRTRLARESRGLARPQGLRRPRQQEPNQCRQAPDRTMELPRRFQPARRTDPP